MGVLTRNRLRFGPFELDPQSGELFKLGQKLNLHGQPIEVLSILLDRPSELVTREEFCQRLWPKDTFVDFEHSLNTAIKKLRQTLDDDPDAPHYIETLPKKGYRFVAKVEAVESVAVAEREFAKSTDDPAAVSLPASLPIPQQTETEKPKSRRWVWAVAAVAVLAVVAGVAYQVWRPRVPVVTAIHQLTHTGRRKAWWFTVTDGTRVYFTEFNEGKWHVAQVSTKGGEVSYFELPQIGTPRTTSISDDGSELLILDFDATGSEFPYWVASLPDGAVRRIPGMYAAMWFLPGSNQVVYFHTDHRGRMFASDLDGSRTRLLADLPAHLGVLATSIGVLAISPDATRVRYNKSDGTLWESPTNGSASHRILPELNQPACCSNWPPDGKLYLFSSQVSSSVFGDYNLWAVNESGWKVYRRPPRPTQLTFGPISFRYSTASKDGKHLFALGQTLRGELSLYDAEARTFRKYLGGISAGLTDFSRDGQWVAYVTHPQGDLWRSRVDGSERLQVTFPPLGPVLNPRWSPDGRFIVFSQYAEQNKIYLVSADGGAPLLLVSGDLQPADPGWSPDGKSIVYGGLGGSPSSSEIRILDLLTKQSKTVAGSQGLFSPRWSPDGRYLAALSGDMTQMFMYDFATGHWQLLPRPNVRGVAYVLCPAWSHDSRYIYFNVTSSVNTVGVAKIYRLRVPAGRPELIASPAGAEVAYPVFPWGGWFELTPDDHVLMMLERSEDEMYALDVEYR